VRHGTAHAGWGRGNMGSYESRHVHAAWQPITNGRPFWRGGLSLGTAVVCWCLGNCPEGWAIKNLFQVWAFWVGAAAPAPAVGPAPPAREGQACCAPSQSGSYFVVRFKRFPLGGGETRFVPQPRQIQPDRTRSSPSQAPSRNRNTNPSSLDAARPPNPHGGTSTARPFFSFFPST